MAAVWEVPSKVSRKRVMELLLWRHDRGSPTQSAEHPHHNSPPTKPDVSGIVLQPAEVSTKGHIGVLFWNWTQSSDNRNCRSSETAKQC